MKRLPSAEDLPAHLDRQLIYLQNSVAAYYNCCVEETKRIGVAIRVRCHGNPPFSLTREVERLCSHGQSLLWG